MGAIQPVESIMRSLVTPQMQHQLRAALPKHCTPERMLRVVRTALTTTPKLAACTPLSVIASVVEASQLGLEPNTALGQCYLIPYKDQCQLQIGYKGLVELARRSGQINGISAESVHEKDSFVAALGTNNTVEHSKDESGEPSAFRAAYAVAWFHDGGHQFVVMYKHEIDKVRKASKAENRPDSPWNMWYEEMAKKTVVKRLCKLLPLSIEFARALANDDNADVGRAQMFTSDVFAAPAIDVDSAPADDVRRRIDDAKRGNPRTPTPPAADPEPAHGEASADEIAELHALVTQGSSEAMLKIAKSVACKDVEELLNLRSDQRVRTAIKRINDLNQGEASG